MSWIAVGSAAIGAAGSIIGGSKAKKAAKAQAKVQREALRLQERIYNQSRQDQEPWRQSGMGALNALNRLMGIKPVNDSQAPQMTAEQAAQLRAMGYPVPDPVVTPDGANEDRYGGFYASPGYQFRMDEGIRSLDRSAAARGMLRSGGQMRALTRYGQGVASDEFGNYYNRLSNIAGLGQTATNNQATLGQNFGVNASNALMNAGNARASGYLSQGQMYGNLAGIGADLFTRLYGNKNSDVAAGGGASDNYLRRTGAF